jgi:phosphonate transport system substrate-binding protein
VVSRAEFETMCELNPQIGQQLKIIATSPEVVTSVLCFRADYAPAFKPQLFTALRDLYKTPAGQQVLTIFQSEKIEDQPASCMDSALELLAAHDRICGVTNITEIPASSPMAGSTAP